MSPDLAAVSSSVMPGPILYNASCSYTSSIYEDGLRAKAQPVSTVDACHLW